LNGTTVLNTLGLLNGAGMLRVHDPKEARQAIALLEAYKNTASSH
jgi:dihydropteroate synthase